MSEIKDRLIFLVNKLNAMRNEVLGFYCTELEKFTSNDGNPSAASRGGILHDLDKHITNLELEIDRIEKITVAEALNG